MNPNWDEETGFQLPQEEPNICRRGESFLTWVEELCAKVAQDPQEWVINRAYLLLQHRYFRWYSAAPVRCREAVSDRSHFCIYHAYRQGYERLLDIELGVAPVEIDPPAPPPPPRQPRLVQGIIIPPREDD